jgi:hypothetical protein
MYSDESTFKCMTASRAMVRRPEGASRYDSRYDINTHHQDCEVPGQCDDLGLFFWLFRAWGSYFLPKNTTMNGERYQTVPEDHLLQFVDIRGCAHVSKMELPATPLRA